MMRVMCVGVRKVLLVSDRGEAAADVEHLRPHEVEVHLLADKDQVPVIRALAADMAIRQDFDLDTVDDLRLAVEEACAAVIACAGRDDVLVCRLMVTSTEVEITASVPVQAGRQPAVGPFSLRILRTLSDTVDFWTTGTGAQRFFHARLAKSVT
jgi:serine/threonine-protein kinase RsbW